jgi:uncharacterized membrane protein YjgN (DUF898 family)
LRNAHTRREVIFALRLLYPSSIATGPVAQAHATAGPSRERQNVAYGIEWPAQTNSNTASGSPTMNPEAGPSVNQPFEFSGKGGEYFRIWIVNLALTIITLGIYSAWAKVRRLQYFHRNTTLLGNSFDYHGSPIAILKGRLIGLGLLAGYNLAFAFNMALGMSVFFLLIAALPWLVQRSVCFKLHNSSYRGLRFRFNGTVGGAYGVLLGWPLLNLPALGLLTPLVQQRLKAYLHGNSAFGVTSFNFSAGAGEFYRLFLKLLGMIVIPLIVFVTASAMLNVFGGMGSMPDVAGARKDPAQMQKIIMPMIIATMMFYLTLFLVIGPWFAARMQNLVWNRTALAQHTFTSRVRARDLLLLYVTNFIAIVLTLGLFKPFADIRLAKYRLTHMALQTQGNMDEFFAHEQQAVTALGEETAHLFDVDISF